MMRANLQKHRVARWALTALAGAVLTACGGSDAPTNDLPAGITQVSSTVYPATAAGKGDTAATQDLLTGGIGKTGLGLATAPAYADPANPTAAELRRNALYSNYRGILDGTTAGGYGSLYGPNVTAAGTVTTSEGLIPGREYVAVLDDGSGRKRTVIAVQVPDSFNPANPCVVLGASSGSRGVYGAIGTAGEWGLKKGCAVALTDAGKGVGIHDLTDDTVHKVDGTRATRTAAGSLSFFAANITDAARAAYNALFPNRLAIKHVHSQMNPEKDWGSDTLAAGRYAMYVLNERYGTDANRVPFTTDNTIVIAGSASNGGAASLRAAEQDTSGLIDGVVASEPVTEMPTASGYGIQFGGAAVAGYGKTLADFTTFGNIYQPCAALAQSFATANGTSNGTPVSVVYNDSVGGAKSWQFAVSPSTGVADFGLDNALCQRALVTGVDSVTGAALTASSTPSKAQSDAVRAGIAEVVLNGNLRGKPTIIVSGRSDALVPVNNNSRAYTAYNRVVEGASTKLRYIEVTNGQHFDTFLPFSGFDTRFVPLHPYFNQAMDAMYAHLKSGGALPPSQVVRTTPRGGVPGAAPAITAANVPPFVAAPAAGDQIGFVGTSVSVPN